MNKHDAKNPQEQDVQNKTDILKFPLLTKSKNFWVNILGKAYKITKPNGEKNPTCLKH